MLATSPFVLAGWIIFVGTGMKDVHARYMSIFSEAAKTLTKLTFFPSFLGWVFLMYYGSLPPVCIVSL